jgi:hypothetical protein
VDGVLPPAMAVRRGVRGKPNQAYSRLFKVIQGYSRLFKVIQGYSRLFKVIQG